MPDKRLGLVLSGGGGKGAYQIGVWRFLREAGIERYVSALSGTSVGALNSVLFASGNLEKAEELWLTKVQDAVLTQDEKVWESRKREGMRNLHMLFNKPLDALGNLFDEAVEVARNGICDRKGLCSLIDESLDLSFIRSCPVNLYAACTRISGNSRAVF
ncbi:MAG: patatin-like phospholipase family protein, partial [Treponema sp.]|nr:patatin-like phospholipase family protein [Treponema sp.]